MQNEKRDQTPYLKSQMIESESAPPPLRAKILAKSGIAAKLMPLLSMDPTRSFLTKERASMLDEQTKRVEGARVRDMNDVTIYNVTIGDGFDRQGIKRKNPRIVCFTYDDIPFEFQSNYGAPFGSLLACERLSSQLRMFSESPPSQPHLLDTELVARRALENTTLVDGNGAICTLHDLVNYDNMDATASNPKRWMAAQAVAIKGLGNLRAYREETLKDNIQRAHMHDVAQALITSSENGTLKMKTDKNSIIQVARMSLVKRHDMINFLELIKKANDFLTKHHHQGGKHKRHRKSHKSKTTKYHSPTRKHVSRK
jgi:hypothetical protein